MGFLMCLVLDPTTRDLSINSGGRAEMVLRSELEGEVDTQAEAEVDTQAEMHTEVGIQEVAEVEAAREELQFLLGRPP